MRYLLLVFLLFTSFSAFSLTNRDGLQCDLVSQGIDPKDCTGTFIPNPDGNTSTNWNGTRTWVYGNCYKKNGGPCCGENETASTDSGKCGCEFGEDENGNCNPPCPDGSAPDIFGRCPVECPDGQVYDEATDSCYPNVCEDGTLNCCDSATPPQGCPNPNPCDDLTDPECSPEPEPDCGENQTWNGTTCVNQEGGESSVGGQSSEGSSEGGDTGDNGNTGTNGNEGGEGGSSSEGGSGGGSDSEGSNNSEGAPYTGSGDCSVPPTCEAGEPDCELLKQQFEQHCKITEYVEEPFFDDDEQEGKITEAFNDFKSRVQNAPIVNSINNFFSMPAASGGCPTYSVDIGFTSFVFDHWCADWIPWDIISGILLAVSIFIAARIALT